MSVQIAYIDSIEVDDVNLSKPREHKILKKLAPNTAGAYHEHAQLETSGTWSMFISTIIPVSTGARRSRETATSTALATS